MPERTFLAISRSSIGAAELRTGTIGELADGQIRLTVDHVAITANTITYAQYGDLLGYWGFYPLDDEWGMVPAVGWGTVVDSKVDGIDAGEHVYGWFPMATTVDFAAKATADGFRDDGPHRAAHASIYRTFTASDRDPMYTGAGDEERHSLVRVLYLTGFLIESFFERERFAGVEQSIVMSASSKTAIGYAFAARRARDAHRHVADLIGVTSAGNVEFVSGLGLYDEVISYADVASVRARPSVIVDMSGAGAAVAAAHEHLADLIAHSMIIGKSHHDDPGAPVTAGPQPALFFAPTEAEQLAVEAGPDEYRRRVGEGVAEFVADTHRWLEIERHNGPDSFAGAWARVFGGGVPPSVGVIASMQL